ncbi:MAG: hypothetical protein ABIQ57_03505 [Candidatus Kapaibacterium sp.]
MPKLILIHGYSDHGESFNTWRDLLGKDGYDLSAIHTCNYQTLTNEVTLRDIAEGFDRALSVEVGLEPDEEFDVIVHSTGMLVIRAWLATYAGRRRRLNHLIALAPATFGSPLAHKGRSWLGAIFKGNKILGPDFLEAGDCILDGLELGGKFTWDLAHIDLLGEKQCYGPDADTPYVFIFCGLNPYGGLARFVSDPGTDGTVRWAGCPLNTRKIVVDLTKRRADRKDDIDMPGRIWATPWSNIDIPLVPIKDRDHGSILADPPPELVSMVRSALAVSTRDEWDAWHSMDVVRHAVNTLVPGNGVGQWQQFVVRATDERGDPITDYYLELGYLKNGEFEKIEAFDADVHVYSSDKSFRCFYMDLNGFDKEDHHDRWLRVVASSGTKLVGYYGEGSDKLMTNGTVNSDGTWDAQIKLPPGIPVRGNDGLEIDPFYPFTTTLVELRLDREPLPLTGKNLVVNFLSYED